LIPLPHSIPARQYAVQLIGPDRLRLNREKEVPLPGPHGILARVEAVGLCFSDLKLLKQFAQHPRKGEITSGVSTDVLREIPSFVPGDMPTVPGHEAACRIVRVGNLVKHHNVGERVLVQADYRCFRTAGSNAAFGYNFEGALQEYVYTDERVAIDPATGGRFLIPVGEDLSASAVALVEPWACVEDSYVSAERRGPKPGGHMLVVADTSHLVEGLAEAFRLSGKPARITAVCPDPAEMRRVGALGVPLAAAPDVAAVPDESCDDVVYFGARRETVEALNGRLSHGGIINIVLGGKRIGEDVSVGVGRVHYGLTRWVGTRGTSAAESYSAIPPSGEVRPGEKIVVVGAGGPMGQMHVIRGLASGVPGIEITATDVDDARLAALAAKTLPLAKARGVPLRLVNSAKGAVTGKASYVALMAPVASLVADAVKSSAAGCLINIFAGIPAAARQPLDLDAYIANRCFMCGSSGSIVRDMMIVLSKVESGRLDTNASVDAVSGMAGALDGLAAVEHRTLSGKIIVYPMLHDLGLVPLSRLSRDLPEVARKLDGGLWSKAAEEELLRESAG